MAPRLPPGRLGRALAALAVAAGAGAWAATGTAGSAVGPGSSSVWRSRCSPPVCSRAARVRSPAPAWAYPALTWSVRSANRPPLAAPPYSLWRC